jgi:hypothetical protein
LKTGIAHSAHAGSGPRSQDPKTPGRPTKQTESLKSAVLTLVCDGAWSAKDGIVKLRRLLVERGEPKNVPSIDTLERLVYRLYLETGDLAFRREPRVGKKFLPQNSSEKIEATHSGSSY